MYLENAVKGFLMDLQLRNRSKGTIKEYEKDLRMFLRYLGAGVDLSDVNQQQMNSYLNSLVDKNYQSSSRNRQMNTLRSFFKYCKKYAYVSDNQAEHLERLEETQVERVFLTTNEVNVLIKSIEHSLVQLVIITLFFTGIRISECLGLELADVDFTHKTILIRNGKGGKTRKLPLHPDLEEALQRYIDQWRVSTSSPKLFLTGRSGKLSDVYVNRILKDTVKKLNWDKKVTCHVLRHSFASALVANNVHIVAIKELLGHVNLTTTSGYAHIQHESVEQAIKQLAL